jgi:6-pyruvoyltetrahydropterin/6-carboxytetrahydropterin synthase
MTRKLGFYEVTRRIEWDMAHRIPLHGGKCQHLHGHRYAAEITCRARELDEMGAVVDFGLIKQLVGGWVDAHWDHNTCYYGGDGYMEALDRAHSEAWSGAVPEREWFVLDKPPTAENLAEELCGVANDLLSDHNIQVVRIDLWETPNCRATYEPWTAELEETLMGLQGDKKDG